MQTGSRPAAVTRDSSRSDTPRYLFAQSPAEVLCNTVGLSSSGSGGLAAILGFLHVPLPHLSAYLTIAAELLGGTALVLGACVAWASVPAIVDLLTAMFTVHLPYGFSSIKLKAVVDGRAQFGPPGYECDLLYLACILTLVSTIYA